jgi:prepilin-type processing-associated H-X9-DG protein
MTMDDPEPQMPKRRRPPFLLRQGLIALKVLRWMLMLGIVAVALLVVSLPHLSPYHLLPNCARNMKDIALAVEFYAQAHRCYPPAYIADKNGKPMHSWRVLILPFLEQDALYKEYDFSEPWNGPHNSCLMKKYPAVFHCHQAGHQDPSAADYVAPDPSATNYVAVVGDGTLWPGSSSVGLQNIKDGESNTIMFVEVAESDINWMEPRDLSFDRAIVGINVDKRHGISGYHNGRANFAFADGSVRQLSEKLSLETLKASLTIAGGEKIDEESIETLPPLCRCALQFDRSGQATSLGL